MSILMGAGCGGAKSSVPLLIMRFLTKNPNSKERRKYAIELVQSV
jgi:hypothetical protein